MRMLPLAPKWAIPLVILAGCATPMVSDTPSASKVEALAVRNFSFDFNRKEIFVDGVSVDNKGRTFAEIHGGGRHGPFWGKSQEKAPLVYNQRFTSTFTCDAAAFYKCDDTFEAISIPRSVIAMGAVSYWKIDNLDLCSFRIVEENLKKNAKWSIKGAGPGGLRLNIFAHGSITPWDRYGSSVVIRVEQVRFIDRKATAEERKSAGCRYDNQGGSTGHPDVFTELAQCIKLPGDRVGTQMCVDYTIDRDGRRNYLGAYSCGHCY